MILLFRVTARDILLAHDDTDLRSRSCPVARAISRRLRKPYFASVGTYYASVNDNHTENLESITLPKEVGGFIRRFDSEGEGKPFNFRADVSDDYLKARPNG